MKNQKVKTYIVTLSKAFPSTHKRKGEPTEFFEAFHAGQETRKIRTFSQYRKLHTIRANYDLWRKRFDEIQAGRAVLSVRQWQGRPRQSKQEVIAVLTAADGIGIEKLRFEKGKIIFPTITTDRFNYSQEPKQLANNDGLSFDDWSEWFKDYDLTKPLAVIHFTKFRYAHED